jgi:transposase
MDATKLVFLDETFANTTMARRYGRSARGERCMAHAPFGHWKTTTFLAALRSDAIVAPLVLDGPMDGPIFLAWVEQFLVPTLSPGDIVIADNLSSHKVAGVRTAIEATGAQYLNLPAYSPDLNPIENFFSKLKAGLRAMAPRTIEDLWNAIASIIDSVGSQECLNYILGCNYVIT